MESSRRRMRKIQAEQVNPSSETETPVNAVGMTSDEEMPPNEGEQDEGLPPSDEMQNEEPTTQPSPVERTNMVKLTYRSMYTHSRKKYAEMTPILSSLSKANLLLSTVHGVQRDRT